MLVIKKKKPKVFCTRTTAPNRKEPKRIQIRDGLAVSWDGRIIRHCSSWVDCGEENSVFGFFISTKDKKEKKKNQPKIENLCYHQTSSEPFFIQKENPK